MKKHKKQEKTKNPSSEGLITNPTKTRIIKHNKNYIHNFSIIFL